MAGMPVMLVIEFLSQIGRFRVRKAERALKHVYSPMEESTLWSP
jgi:hypothetical protein